jgi:hypothetical protein
VFKEALTRLLEIEPLHDISDGAGILPSAAAIINSRQLRFEARESWLGRGIESGAGRQLMLVHSR